MEKQFNILSDRGLSFIELLVALAVSAIIISAAVILITNGLNTYNKQTTAAKLQENADITMNQISDKILEANLINIGNFTSDKKITTKFKVANDRIYLYDSANKILYYGDADSYDDGNILCTHVTNFKVQVIRSGVNTEAGPKGTRIASVNNPVQLKVTLELSDGDIKRSICRVTGVRNNLDTEDKPENLTLQNFRVGDFPDYDVLNVCEFLAEK